MLVLSSRVDETIGSPSPDSASPSPSPASLQQLNELMDRRLAIARKGLAEMRKHLAAGQAKDAQTILEKLDEDLDLLRGRLHPEAEPAAPRKTVLIGCANAVSESN